MMKSADINCYLLAEHFLKDAGLMTDSNVETLAKRIQERVEDFISYEARPIQPPPSRPSEGEG